MESKKEWQKYSLGFSELEEMQKIKVEQALKDLTQRLENEGIVC